MANDTLAMSNPSNISKDLEWLIVVVLPEADFMPELRRARNESFCDLWYRLSNRHSLWYLLS